MHCKMFFFLSQGGGCEPAWYGDGHCDSRNNNAHCNFDGGDCPTGPPDYSGFLTLYCLMLIASLIQAAAAIVASGYSCAAVCCRQNSKYPGTVIYAPPTNSNNQTFVPAPVSLNFQMATQSNGKNVYIMYISIIVNRKLKQFLCKIYF